MTVDLGIPDIVPPISNSELQTWMDCRRRWYLTYYREMGPKKRAVTGALAFGSRIHLALEKMYTDDMDPVDVYDDEHLHAIHALLVHEQETGFVDTAMRDKLQKERELAHAMLEGYVSWLAETGADEGLRLAGAEIVVEVLSGIPGVRLRGKLDQRIYREVDGARLFKDFKTAANLTDGPQMLPIDEQMKFYMLLERLDSVAKTGGEPSEPTMGGLYVMLKKVKRTARATPPFYAQVEVRHNQLEMESMWLRTHRRLQEILEARRQLDDDGDHRYWVYPRPSRDCSWKCDFMALCPMMDDSKPETWNAMLNDLYEPTDPYARYDEEEAKA